MLVTQETNNSIFQYDEEFLYIYYQSGPALNKFSITGKKINLKNLVEAKIIREINIDNICIYIGYVLTKQRFTIFLINGKQFELIDATNIEYSHYYPFDDKLLLITNDKRFILVTFNANVPSTNIQEIIILQHNVGFSLRQLIIPCNTFNSIFFQDGIRVINGFDVHEINYENNELIYRYARIPNENAMIYRFVKQLIVFEVLQRKVLIYENIRGATLTSQIDNVRSVAIDNEKQAIAFLFDNIVTVSSNEGQESIVINSGTEIKFKKGNLFIHNKAHVIPMVKRYASIFCAEVPMQAGIIKDNLYFMLDDNLCKMVFGETGDTTSDFIEIPNPKGKKLSSFKIHDGNTFNREYLIGKFDDAYYYLDDNEWIELFIVSNHLIKSHLNLFDEIKPLLITNLMIDPDFPIKDLFNVISCMDLQASKLIINYGKMGRLISEGDGVFRDVFQKIITWGINELFHEGAYLTFKKQKQDDNFYYRFGMILGYYFIVSKTKFPFRFPIQILCKLCNDRCQKSNLMEFWKRINPDNHQKFMQDQDPTIYGYNTVLEMLKINCCYQNYSGIEAFDNGIRQFVMFRTIFINPQTLDYIFSGEYNQIDVYHKFFEKFPFSNETTKMKKFFMELSLKQYQSLFMNWSSTWIPDGENYVIVIKKEEPYFKFHSCLKKLEVSPDFVNSPEEWARLYEFVTGMAQ